MNIEWPGFFSIALKNKELSQEKIRQYSLDTLRLSNVDTLLLVNVDGCLKDYISGLADYLKIDSVDNNKVKESLKELEVSFEKIDYDSNVTRKYDISSETTAILKVLKENTWIYDYYAAEDDSEKYIIVKNPPK